MKRVVVLGASGSVGGNTLAVIRENPGDFEVAGLVAGRPGETLAALCREFPGAAVALGPNADPAPFRAMLAPNRPGRFFDAPDGAVRLVSEVGADVCVAAISGLAGLEPTFAAAAAGRTILLANKEVLVSAGDLFMAAVRAGGSSILPLDSEHAALWQCLEGRDRSEASRVIITASGGPFLRWTREAMAKATPADALRHPVWRMGAKISVDSATLANKALELVEARHLFGFPFDAMEVLVHPQAMVHGIVEFADGSLIAHMGVCDMRQPIAHMLFRPERRETRLPRVDLAAVARLDFARPDEGRFPMLAIGREAGRRGGKYPALFNAANAAAVELFLAGRLPFPAIAKAVEATVAGGERGEFSCLAEVADLHERTRRKVLEFAGARG